MSDFKVKIEYVKDVIPHPNADRLSIIKINGYNCVSANLDDGTPRYKKGQAVVYIPEASIVPEWLLKKAGFWDESKNRGMLAGSQYNRVKPIRLRGIFSEGILYPVTFSGQKSFNVVCNNLNNSSKDAEENRLNAEDTDIYTYDRVIVCGERAKADLKKIFNVGDDVAEFLGITKYEPTIPAHMSGEVFYLPEKAHKYDVEALKKFPDVIQIGEKVVYQEKIHGTQFTITICHQYQNVNLFGQHNNVVLQSKGLGSRGKVFKNVESNHDKNIYVKMFDSLYETNLTFKYFVDGVLHNDILPHDITIFGEIFGKGVQDLDYKSTTQPSFRVFDVLNGREFLDYERAVEFVEMIGLNYVPEIGRGPFDIDYAKILASGTESVSGSGAHIREGVVVKPLLERNDPFFGRPILKYVSEEYTLRKGNTTEYN